MSENCDYIIDICRDHQDDAELPGCPYCEIKRLHDLHFERTKLTHKVLLDVEKRNKRIDEFETVLEKLLSVKGDHMTACD